MARQHFLAAGAACLIGTLAATGVARAQFAAPEPGVASGFTAGSPYSFRPLDINWAYYAPPPPVERDVKLRNQPIFMTSINYPGVYGAFTMGATPTSYYDFNPQFIADAIPGATSSLRTRLATRLAPDPAMQPARIDVKVPSADAKLTFDTYIAPVTGLYREFVTPALDPAVNYRYTVRATWVEDGVERGREKDVYLRSGDRLLVDLTSGQGTFDLPSMRAFTPTESAPALRTAPPPAVPTPPPALRTLPPPAERGPAYRTLPPPLDNGPTLQTRPRPTDETPR